MKNKTSVKSGNFEKQKKSCFLNFKYNLKNKIIKKKKVISWSQVKPDTLTTPLSSQLHLEGMSSSADLLLLRLIFWFFFVESSSSSSSFSCSSSSSDHHHHLLLLLLLFYFIFQFFIFLRLKLLLIYLDLCRSK